MTTETATENASQVQQEVLISADSHTMEDPGLWAERLAPRFREQAPKFTADEVRGFAAHPGGHDPNERLKEMGEDGVSAEVLYPTLGLRLFGMQDAALQEACFTVYNDWAMEYCKVAPERLVGVSMISTYDIDHAVKELERCARGGLPGALVWQAPHPDLPFTSDHYDRLWAAAQDAGVAVSLHILTGFGYSQNLASLKGLDLIRHSVNTKIYEASNALYDLIFSGALERFPRLKIVFVENEVGWMPFAVEQWDRYYKRFQERLSLPLSMLPSEYVQRQVYSTFFNDPSGGYLLSYWGQENCMWSNDYPHPNSTWPNSRDVIGRQLSHLSPETRAKVVRENVSRLYGLRPPEA